MRTAMTGIVLLAGLLVAAPLASGLNLDVDIDPQTPVTEKKITATFPAPEGATNATVFVCPGDSCRPPADMQRENGVFSHAFYINETIDVHLSIRIEYQNGTVAWDNATTFKVTKAGESGNVGIPGFTAGALLAAVVVIAALLRRTKS